MEMLDILVNWLSQYGYWGFFVASFLSATVLPFSSELILSGLLLTGASPMMCVLLGTLGNTLGGLTCYWLGSLGKIEWLEKFLHIKKEDIEKRRVWVDRWGAFAAFWSFLPVVGDAINVVLGFLRTNFWWVVIFMTLGKFLRYFFWMLLNNAIFG